MPVIPWLHPITEIQISKQVQDCFVNLKVLQLNVHDDYASRHLLPGQLCRLSSTLEELSLDFFCDPVLKIPAEAEFPKLKSLSAYFWEENVKNLADYIPRFQVLRQNLEILKFNSLAHLCNGIE